MIEGKKCPVCEKGKLKRFVHEAEPEIFVNAFKCSHCGEVWFSEKVTERLEALRKGSASERRLVKVGNSIAAIIPSDISKRLRLREKETIFVREEGGEIRIRPRKARTQA
ncbi:MAG: AbrB/MazE/SpoVT family DNA-binding domain-containing protein [Candidatus Diapherotrites archaeon]